MTSPLFSRLTKPFLVTCACTVIGFGMIDHAMAQKGNVFSDVSTKSSSFFSFDLLGKDRPIIHAAMVAAMENGKAADVSFRDAPAMQAFYTARDGKTDWVDMRGHDHDKAAAVLAVLENSWTHALNPQNYHVREIRELLNASAPEDKARLELLVTDAVIRYGRDMTGMHLPPNSIGQDPQFWRKPMDAATVLNTLDEADDVTAALENLAPHDALYIRLREELMALNKNPDRAGDAYLPLAFNVPTLRPGDLNRDVPKLRGRLGLVYDPVNGSERKYDDTLAAAVMSFQRENGLEADGNIGPKTVEMLNRSVGDKINQIVANMERLRWLDEAKPERYILVNIPSQTLWAVDHGNVALEMPVIVGRPERATKSFVTNITGVRFNPKWTVPPTIKTNDMLTHLQEDPTYLDQKGIELSHTVDGRRETLDPSSINWADVTKSEIVKMHMVQGAGDNNALGKVRVLMQNPYDIYLHDTSSPELFSKSDRALSSGCIRLSNPEAVARFILTGNDGWTDQKMKSIIGSGRTSEVNATTQIPVYIVYQTVWLDDVGRLVYGRDLYKQDKALLGVMTAMKTYAIPEAQKVKYASIDQATPLR